MLTSLLNFWTELRRRRVVRTLAGYGAAAFIVLQIADLVLPAFTDSDWAYRAIVLLVLVGIPVTAIIAWLYDRTDEGVVRVATSSNRVPAFIGLFALTILVIVSSGWFVVKRVRAQRVDANAIAVFPFRVAGASNDLAFLREGMLDLLSTKLADDVAHKPLDPHAILRAVKDDTDESAIDFVALARSLGAGKVVLGDVVGTSANLTISARLIDAITGRTLARASERGNAESYADVVDRLAASLLSLEAGESAERLAVLTSTSPDALRAYLNGQSLYRRARFAEAIREFQKALTTDSTFSLAAMATVATYGWANTNIPGLNRRRAEEVAWAGRERFGMVDRAILQALLGPRFPRPASEREKCEGWRRVVSLAPDRVEAWHHVGDCYFHYGRVIADDKALDKAKDAFERSLQRDSLYSPSLVHLAQLAAGKRDVAATDRYARLYLSADSLGDHRHLMRWFVAYARDDRATMRRMLAGIDTIPAAGQIAEFHQWYDDDGTVERIYLESRERIGTQNNLRLLVSAGRTEDARSFARANPNDGFVVADVIEGALYADADTALAAEFAERLVPYAAPGSGVRASAACGLAEWSTWHRQEERARQMYAIVDSATSAKDPQQRELATICRMTLDAIRAGVERRPDAHAHALRIDSLATELPRYATFQSRYMYLMAARLLEMSGDKRGALRAVRRWPYQLYVVPGFAYGFAEEGRLAAALGDRDAAIAAYRRHLKYRTAPEGRAAETTKRVRADLARLTGEPKS